MTEDDFVKWVRSRPWWSAVDGLARDGWCVVVHDPEAPECYGPGSRSGMLTYQDAKGRFVPECGSIHISRGKRKDVWIRLIKRGESRR
jgi:hypothetical protein